jgi:hypothetical protein
MRLIVAGGRDFTDLKLFNKVISDKLKFLKGKCYSLKQNIEIVSGMATGADTLGKDFAYKWNLKLAKFPAEWDKYGKSAGYKRNEQMAVYAKEDNGVLLAFWDGKSKGTKHMIDLANKHDLIVFVVNY